MSKSVPYKEIKKKVDVALNYLHKQDSFLLKNNAHERSIAYKLAEYLQQQFSEWNVDCEYNRIGKEGDLKDIYNIRVFPDIIVHKRGVKINLLAVEIKKGKISKNDEYKLNEFTLKNGRYNYKCGLFIEFNKSNKFIKTWFQNGKQKQ